MHPCLSLSSCAHSPGPTAGLQPGLSSLGRWRHGAAGLPFHRLPSCGLPGWLPEVTSSFLPGDGLTGGLWEEQDPFTLGGVGNTLFGSLVTNEPLGLPFGGACLFACPAQGIQHDPSAAQASWAAFLGEVTWRCVHALGAALRGLAHPQPHPREPALPQAHQLWCTSQHGQSQKDAASSRFPVRADGMQGDSWRAVLSYLHCKQGGCGCSQCASSSGKSHQSCPLVQFAE